MAEGNKDSKKSTLPNYMHATDLVETNLFAGGGTQVVNPVLYGQKDIMSKVGEPDILQGIECTPYQFMDSVDRRYVPNGNDKNDIGSSMSHRYLGQKYAQKVISQMPLVFFTPCEPVFMQDFSDDDKTRVLGSLMSSSSGSNDSKGLLEFVMDKNAQYYGITYAYAEYYNYVNLMLSSIAYYLGIQDEEISINGGKPVPLRLINWANETNSAFKSYFAARENVMFFADSLSSISLGFENNTVPSSLASQINGFSEQIHEIQYLLGGDESAISQAIDISSQGATSILDSASDMLGSLAGGIVGSLADRGIDTILNGGKIQFPEIWSDSQHNENYSINFKLRSPDHDNLSIFLNILKPYCMLLGLTLPRVIDGNANGYRSPFLVRCSSKGLFNINMGIIDSMNVEKGEECQWNDEGLPTQMDISISVKNLYTHLAMSGYADGKYLVSNTQYQDFLANTAGLNVLQYTSDVGEKLNYKIYNLSEAAASIPGRTYNSFSQSISNLVYNVYRRV